MIKIAITSVPFNHEQLEAFQRLFEAYSLFSKPMKSKSFLKIHSFSLVIYTNITRHTLTQTRLRHMSAHIMVCFAPFIFMVFYCNGWRTDRFDNLTTKGFNLHLCKSNFRRPAKQNLFSISSSNLWLLVHKVDIPLSSMCHSNHVFDVTVFCCSCQLKSQDQFIGPIFRIGHTKCSLL